MLISVFAFLSFYVLMPSSNEEKFVPANEFSVDRAMTPLLEITKKPHYLGSDGHSEVRALLLSELQKLGLDPHIQTDFNLNSSSKVLTKPTNIVARIKGTEQGKALLLLSHYDSAAVASYGAADDASGLVTILESVRAFLSSGTPPKNDIIILFTDSEEISLDGAQLFVEKHPWIKDVGLVINFEARGTKGPSNMILETNHGNAGLIRAFSKAGSKYPVASSLMYSVYKLLPNDTDSTVFRELADIDSFFFAFIDGHYNYHTANDTYYNLDRNSLMHQGSYLVPMLHHFANVDLSNLKAENDHVYFNFPFLKIIHYPFSWIYPMVILSLFIFLVLIFYGRHQSRISARAVLLGFLPLTGAIGVSGIIGFLGWKLLLLIYPHYLEIQQGFTYNGHWYIALFVTLSIGISFIFYRAYSRKYEIRSLYVAPLVLWLIINLLISVYLKGAAFFIVPFIFGLISFYHILKRKEPNLILLTILAIPALFILVPLIQFFPVGLGLKMLVTSCVFTVLLFSLLLPVFGLYKIKGAIIILSFAASGLFFILAHSESKFSESRKKPNSLIFYQDLDNNKAYWTTYDLKPDSWTSQYLGEHPEPAVEINRITSYNKYGRQYTFATETETKNLEKSEIVLIRDSVADNSREIEFILTPRRNINKIELFASSKTTFDMIEFNGQKMDKSLESTYRGTKNSSLINYYVSDNANLHVYLKTTSSEPIEFEILEYSFDLLENPFFNIPERTKETMPKPFVITDAIVVKHSYSSDSSEISSGITN